eukprot:GEMP01055725.1.p1 GENE.GEMP01055725.1~~GEMP01055725.1.p1  ORF type:complete len:209 (-),score=18.62 GEMP01055725.1:870-1496(-)
MANLAWSRAFLLLLVSITVLQGCFDPPTENTLASSTTTTTAEAAQSSPKTPETTASTQSSLTVTTTIIETPQSPTAAPTEVTTPNPSPSKVCTEQQCAESQARCVPIFLPPGTDQIGGPCEVTSSEEAVQWSDSISGLTRIRSRICKCDPTSYVSYNLPAYGCRCPCLATEFTCDNGRCIPLEYRCDDEEQNDCGYGDDDYSDEENCQ